MKRLPSIVRPRQKKSWREILETLVLGSRNTSIWGSNVTQALVSMVWTSVWCWVGQVSASQKCRTGCIGAKHRISK
eukprot:bmy_11692T0